MKCQLCKIGEIDNSTAGAVVICSNCGLKYEIVPMTEEDKEWFLYEALEAIGLVELEEEL